jgi:hypothetical protein
MTGMTAACLVTLAATAATASAQDAAGGGQRLPAPQQGPMVVQQISTGWVLTPEIRDTELNHSWGTQLGASGGWVYDDALFVGGGVYGLVGGAGD